MKIKITDCTFSKALTILNLKFSMVLVFTFALLLIEGGNMELNAQKIWEVNPGDNYQAIFEKLQPGDELVFHEGTYTGGAGTIRTSGTPDKPIIIRGYGNGEQRPVLLLESASTNLLQINANNMVLDFMEFQSKHSYAIRLGTSGASNKFENIIIKNCVFYKSGGGDISANYSVAYNNIQILDNFFIAPRKTSIYIGQHDGLANVTNFIFKGNVIDGSQIFGDDITGYGIELKLNVTSSIIENNFITNTKGPGIMVYGAKDSNPANANIVRNNIVVGSRKDAGIVAGAGPSTILDNITIKCNGGGVVIQNYGGRNLLHNIVVNRNTAVCDNNFGMSFGNVQDITAHDNVVITSNSTTAYKSNPNPGVNNRIIAASGELEKVIQGELMHVMPEKFKLDEIWQRISGGPLNEADVMEVIDLIMEYKIPLGDR